ncbi:PRMT5-domain-containing protein, partial [Nadsonia fulvescens var. elongata DSM 6958]
DEVNFLPGLHISNTIALTNNCISLESENDHIHKMSSDILYHEISYAAFCGINYVMLPGPKQRKNTVQYAQAVLNILNAFPQIQIILHMPFMVTSTTGYRSSDPLFTWDIWNAIKTTTDYPPNLYVGLDLLKNSIPSYVTSRWFSEPVKLLSISTKVFIPNAKGYPVLSKAQQQLVTQFMKIASLTIIQDTSSKARASEKTVGGKSAHLVYIRHLHQTRPELTKLEKFATGYYDYLQAPLQPLSDNLDSASYEIFERDPVKYAQYEAAIQAAITDRRGEPELIIAVVGAGRGGIVNCAHKAIGKFIDGCVISNKSDREPNFRIIALEKNINAYLYLLEQQRTQWADNDVCDIEVIFGDMRSWKPQIKLNIIVSELLGSFGDNELSPECLDGVQNLLAQGGTMIPESYTSSLIPVMSHKIYSTAKRQNDLSVFHKPYVVMMQSVDLLATQIETAWKFEHPRDILVNDKMVKKNNDQGFYTSPETNKHNERRCKLSFKIPHKGVVHGFAGFFEAVLYKDIQISIRPDNMDFVSKDMVSWFPIIFLIERPLYLPEQSEIDISLWRKTDDKNVWYEWALESFLRVPQLNKVSSSGSESDN